MSLQTNSSAMVTRQNKKPPVSAPSTGSTTPATPAKHISKRTSTSDVAPDNITSVQSDHHSFDFKSILIRLEKIETAHATTATIQSRLITTLESIDSRLSTIPPPVPTPAILNMDNNPFGVLTDVDDEPSEKVIKSIDPQITEPIEVHPNIRQPHPAKGVRRLNCPLLLWEGRFEPANETRESFLEPKPLRMCAHARC